MYYLHGIAGLLANLRTDIPTDTEDVAYRAIRVFHAHINDTAVVRFAIECCVNLNASLAEFRFEVVWKYYISAVLVRDFLSDGIIIVGFIVQIR